MTTAVVMRGVTPVPRPPTDDTDESFLRKRHDVTKALLGRRGFGVEGATVLKEGFRAVILGSYLNFGLLTAPFAFWGGMLGLGDGMIFILSLFAIIPCAERLSYVTEQLASHLGETTGGLLNATFGNATEVLVAIFALQRGLYRVVQLSLLGSVLSNLLLVLGVSCFVGGLKWKVQTFKVVSGAVPSAMLLIAAMGFLLPAALKMSGQEDDNTDEINFSRMVGVVLLIMYSGFLVFQLRTHTEEFEGDGDPDHSDAALGKYESILWLTVITVFVSLLSEVLVGTIEGFTTEYHVNSVFVSAVVIPVIGNAAEHAAAVIFAYRNRMDICVGIAVGSSIQIALGVLPFCVIFGWFINRPLSLFFNGFETAALMASVLIVTVILHGGTSNWLMGFLLTGAYVVVSCGFWIHEFENLSEAKGLPEGMRNMTKHSATSL